jgi:Heterokaryon incompatibility protein (HET)
VLLEKATLSNHLRGIDTTGLPQTLLDAIEITRDLHIRYLWIDALCIMQDEGSDNLDKLAEIPRMGDIYKNSTLTIVASRSRTVKEGFLHQQFLPFDAVEVPFSQNGKLEKVWLVPQTSPKLGNDPLSTRGWAFQEYMLSTKILRYGTKAVTWHCTSVSASAIHPRYGLYEYKMSSAYQNTDLKVGLTQYGGFFLNTNLRWIDLAIRQQLRRLLSIIYPQDPTWEKVMLRWWPQCVEQYSGCDLSEAKDKLHAIAGIAKEIYKAYPSIYLAGLWQSAIIQHLAWQRNDTLEFARRVTPTDSCDAPTWTWASQSCAIKFLKMRICDAEFVKTSVQPMFSNSPFGDVKGKSLVLSAKLVELKSGSDFAKYPWKEILDTVAADPPTSIAGVSSYTSTRENQKPRRTWYMLLGDLNMYGGSASGGTISREPVGLILAKTENSYKRIGFFRGRAEDESEEQKTMDTILSKLERTQVEIV